MCAAIPQAKLLEFLNGLVMGPHYFCVMLPVVEENRETEQYEELAK